MNTSAVHAARAANVRGEHHTAVLHLDFVHDPLNVRVMENPDELYQLLQSLLGGNYIGHAELLVSKKLALDPDGDTALSGDVNRAFAVAWVRLAGSARKLRRKICLEQAAEYIDRAITIHYDLKDEGRLALDFVVAARISILRDALDEAGNIIEHALSKVARLSLDDSDSASAARNVNYWGLLIRALKSGNTDRRLARDVAEADLHHVRRQVAWRLTRSVRPTWLAARVVRRENSVPVWQRRRAYTKKPVWSLFDIAGQLSSS